MLLRFLKLKKLTFSGKPFSDIVSTSLLYLKTHPFKPPVIIVIMTVKIISEFNFIKHLTNLA